jgi:hypothetical protein
LKIVEEKRGIRKVLGVWKIAVNILNEKLTTASRDGSMT